MNTQYLIMLWRVSQKLFLCLELSFHHESTSWRPQLGHGKDVPKVYFQFMTQINIYEIYFLTAIIWLPDRLHMHIALGKDKIQNTTQQRTSESRFWPKIKWVVVSGCITFSMAWVSRHSVLQGLIYILSVERFHPASHQNQYSGTCHQSPRKFPNINLNIVRW